MSDKKPPLVIAHRGSSTERLENTREAFLLAASQGADMVELDVRHTLDGQLIVNHDAWYRNERSVWSTPSHERPPEVLELTAALDACLEGATARGRAMAVNVEIKNSPGDLGENDDPYSLEFVREVVALLQARVTDGSGEEFVVSSFDPPTVDLVRDLGGFLTAQLVMDPSWHDSIESTAKRGHSFIHPWDLLVDQAYLEAAHEAGLGVNTWTVDDPDRMSVLRRWGVDGVVTNVPAVARSAFE